MSQAVSSTSPGSPTGNLPGALPGNAQPDPIRDFVRTAAVHIRRTELFYGWMTWLSVLLFTLTAFVLIDHWLLEMSQWMRVAIWGALAVWSVGWFIRKIIPPMFYRINPEHAARLIEKQIPDSKDSLISWLQLNEVSATPPKSVLNQIGRYAFKFLRSADATQVADTANLVRLSAAFFGCLLCIAIYFFASPKSGWTSVSRLLLPWANIAPATRVRFVQITPGDTTVMQGSTLLVDVTLRGLHKNEKVQLQYDLSDGQVQGELVPLREEIHGVHYKLEFGKSFGGIHQPLTYWIIAGDAKAGPFQVDIQVVPLVAIDQIELVYPPYTKLKSRTLIQQGQLEVPEGTVASITALANQDMQKGRLEFDPVLQGKSLLSVGETVDMVVDANKLTASWVAKVDPTNRKKRESTYRVKATNSLNEANHDPVIYPVKVIPDLPPEAEFGSGIVGPIDLPVNESVSIEVLATDPDYGLTQVGVLGLVENRLRPSEPKQLFAETLFEATEEEPLKRNLDFVLQPESMSLQPGDVFDLVVVAKDNYHVPGSQQFSPQVAQSSPLRVRVIEASRQNAQDGSAEQNNQAKPNEGTPAAELGADANSKPKTEKIDWNKVPQNNPRDPGKSNRNSSNSKSPQDDPKKANQSSEQQAQDPGMGSGGESGNQASKKADDSARNRNGQQQSGGGGNSSEDSQSQNSGEGGESGAQENSGGESSTSSSNNSKNGSQKQSAKNPSSPAANSDKDAFERIQEFMKEKSGSADTDPSEGSQNRNSKDNNSGRASESMNSDSLSNDPIGDDQTSPASEGSPQASTEKTGSEKTGSEKTGSEKTGSEKTGSEKTGSEKTGSEKTGSEKTGSEKTGSEKTGSEKTGTEQTGSEKTGTEKTGGEKTGGEKTGGEKTGSEKTGGEKTGSEKIGSEKIGSEKIGSEKTGSEKTGGEKTGTEKTGNEKTGTEKTGNEKTGNEKTGNEKTGSEKTGGEKTGGEKTGGEKTGTEKTGTEKTGTEKTGTEKTGGEKTGGEKTGSEKTGSEKTGSEKTGSEKTGSEKTGSEKTGSEKTGSEKTGGEKTGGEKTGGEKSGGEKTGSEKTGGEKTGGEKTGGEKTGGEKTGGEKSGGEKSGGEKSGGEKSGGEKSGGEEAGGKKPTQAPDVQSNGNPDERRGDKSKQEQGGGPGSGNDEGGKDGKPKMSEPNSAGSGMNHTGRAPKSGGSGENKSSQGGEFGSDKARIDYANQATDMMLEYIDRQKDQPDPELLKRLNWSAEDLRQFAEKWKQAKEEARKDPSKRAELEEALRNLGLSGTGQKVNRLKDRDDGLRGMREEGGRLRPPETLREQFEAFRKAAGRIGK